MDSFICVKSFNSPSLSVKYADDTTLPIIKFKKLRRVEVKEVSKVTFA